MCSLDLICDFRLTTFRCPTSSTITTVNYTHGKYFKTESLTAYGRDAEDIQILARCFSCPLHAAVQSYHGCQSLCIDELFTHFSVFFSTPTESSLEQISLTTLTVMTI